MKTKRAIGQSKNLLQTVAEGVFKGFKFFLFFYKTGVKDTVVRPSSIISMRAPGLRYDDPFTLTTVAKAALCCVGSIF
jgi:hypothetical protein